MNQENNQFNTNNLNTQNNNGVPNNQPLNNQSMGVNQPTSIPQSQPTPQPINNTFQSVNVNNFYAVNESVDNIDSTYKSQMNNTVFNQPLNNSSVISSNINFESQSNNQFNNNTIEQTTFTNNYSVPNPPQKKNNKNIKTLIIIVLVVALLIGGLIFIISSFKDKKSNDYNDPSISDAIIVKNSDGLYGIINSNGKQVADFKYSSISTFLNGSAKVQNSNNEVGIINSNGKMVVDFGKYNYIINKGYLYEVTDKDFNKFLLNSKGEILYDLKEASVNSYSIPKEIVIVELENSIDVLDYEGNSLIKLNGNSNYKLYENEDNYTTLYHNNISYIIDIYNRKIVYKENSSTPYCVSSVNNEDKTKYILTECENPKQYISMNNDNKLFSLNDCSNLFFERGNLLCAKDYNRYVVDEKGNKGIEIYNSDIDYVDGKNYVKKGEFGKTEFYTNGKLTKTVDCTSPYIVASRNEGLYILKNTCTENRNTYSYYDNKGNKKLDTNYKVANEFDKNGYAIVSNDGTNKYLINTSGKKITIEYENIDYNQNLKPINIYVARKGNTRTVLNNKGEEILVTEGTVNRYDTYFTVSTNGKTIYYNFDGKEIFKTN